MSRSGLWPRCGWSRGGAVVLLVSWVACPALAADLRTGYQAGAAQSVATTLTNNRDLIATPVMGGSPAPPRASALTRFQGLQLTTGVTGNLTFDLVTRTFNQALLLGTGLSQVLPIFVPGGFLGAVSARVTTVQGTAQYLARLERPSWGIAFGGGYTLAANGRLGTNPDGSVAGTTQGPVLPGTQATAFVVNGLTHSFNTRAELQLQRNRWDLSLLGTYRYTIAGIFSLAPGGALIALGTMPAPGDPQAMSAPPQVLGASGTNLGAFTRASTHVLAPSLTYRVGVGERGHLAASAATVMTVPVTVEDLTIGTGPSAVTFPSPVILPDTVLTSGSLGYLHKTIRDRMVGARVLAVYGTRVRTDPITQAPAKDVPLSPDTLILGARAVYGEMLPWELRVDLEVGFAQPHLYQAPLGFVPFNASFEPIHGKWTPVFTLTAQRKFDPINVSLSVARELGPGATGAVAFLNESISLAGVYLFRLGGDSGKATAGFSFSQRRGFGRELFRPQPAVRAPPCDPATLPIGQLCPVFVNPNLFFDNRAFGGNLGLSSRLYRDGDLSVEGAAAYNLSWLDPDVEALQPNLDGTIGRPSSLSHSVLLTIRATFGRGPLADVAAREADELSAFSRDPTSGSPLTSSRLMQGGPALDRARGARPGEPAPVSRQEYERERRQEQQTDREPEGRSDRVRGSGRIQEDEAEAQKREAEEREERRKRRTRRFSEWPMKTVPLKKAEDQKEDEKKEEQEEEEKQKKKKKKEEKKEEKDVE